MKDIPGFEGKYAATKNGHIYSYYKECLKNERLNKQGYYYVSLYKNGRVKNYNVHALIAKTFIGNVSKGLCVNHKDECKTNNAVDNLEIVSIGYNTVYGSAIERRAKANRGKIRSEESKQRMSDAHKGQFVSEETKKKMSEARLRYLQHQKGCV